jgi:putative spermidine/putrescine transport system substrate-binding protein
MIAVYNGRGYNAVKNGAPYKPVWAGNVYLYDSYMVPVGSPRVNQAMKLINYAVSPAATGRLQDAIPYGAVNSKAPPPTQTGAFLDWLPTSHLKEGVAQDQQWWAENQKIAQQKWLGWFAG